MKIFNVLFQKDFYFILRPWRDKLKNISAETPQCQFRHTGEEQTDVIKIRPMWDVSTRYEFPPGHGCRFVGIILNKGETSVPALIRGAGIHDHICHSVCHLGDGDTTMRLAGRGQTALWHNFSFLYSFPIVFPNSESSVYDLISLRGFLFVSAPQSFLWASVTIQLWELLVFVPSSSPPWSRPSSCL